MKELALTCDPVYLPYKNEWAHLTTTLQRGNVSDGTYETKIE